MDNHTSKKLPRILITGGAGFIGSNFAKYVVQNALADDVMIIDKLTYAGSVANISEIFKEVSFVAGDICSPEVNQLLAMFKPDVIFNFAAETHVDNSIADSGVFMRSNILGVKNLLDALIVSCPNARFVQISTDEVYGQLKAGDDAFVETDILSPRNPYSASKGSADLFVNAYCETFDVDAVITRCCNNYGPNQHFEKLIPKTIINALNDEQIPVYGEGLQQREWIFVIDHCRAIWKAYIYGAKRNVYNIGTGDEIKNIDLVTTILKILNKPTSLITFVKDRKGHDFRYAVDTLKTYRDLHWEPQESFRIGIEKTINFYKNNIKVL